MNDPVDGNVWKGACRYVEHAAVRCMDLDAPLSQKLDEPAANKAAAARHQHTVGHRKRFRSFSNSMVARS
ncbi:hypothetical protein ABIF42_006881 [Bradyrhizobium diazoefficiens]